MCLPSIWWGFDSPYPLLSIKTIKIVILDVKQIIIEGIIIRFIPLYP